MIYKEIAVHTTTEASEVISDILGDYSEFGVSILDNNDVIYLISTNKASWDYADDTLLTKDKDVIVKGYVLKEGFKSTLKEIEERLAYFKQNAFCDFGSLKIDLKDVDGEEWREKWKENFHPIRLDKIVICPDWMDYESQGEEAVIKIDSNMAFGTGEHETTSSCLQLLQKYIKKGDTVIDIGCGSGILGITASKLGANKVIMTDIDQDATVYARHNCNLNHVENADIFCKNLLDDTTIKGDILLANIMAEVLISFSPDIHKNMNTDGIIILSGILLTKEQAVINAYNEQGFKVFDEIKKGEWCALALKR